MYAMVSDALGKLGLSAIIFDIKNIRDTEGNSVIESLERVKIAELNKNAKISEAIHQKESTVKQEEMKLEEEAARLNREQESLAKEVLVDQERLKLEKQQATKKAEIERERLKIMALASKEKLMIEAEASSASVRLRAQAQADAIKMKADADAEAILKKGQAEAKVLEQKNKAMGGNYAAQIELSKIMSVTQIDTAEKIATALGQNNKIMYIPTGGDNGLLSSFMPKMDALLQSGLPSELMDTFTKKKKSTKKSVSK